MRVERLSPALASDWDAFVDSHALGWFFHTSSWIAYEMARGDHDEDLSFAVMDDERFADERVVAICPLLRQGDRLTFEGEPGPLPLHTSCESAPAVLAEVKRHGAAAFRSCPLAAPPSTEAFTVGWRSRVLDLAKPVALLHANLRKSYKALVNRGEREYRIVVDRTGDLDVDYRGVHISAGKIPRRPKSYDFQAQWVREGHAFLVGASERGSGQWAAFAYVLVYKRGAYYASGPSLAPAAMHAVLWRAICEAKARGCEKMELGWQGHATTEKERGIETFKRGWGGVDVPVWIMEVA